MEAGYIYNKRRKFHYFTTAISIVVLHGDHGHGTEICTAMICQNGNNRTLCTFYVS